MVDTTTTGGLGALEFPGFRGSGVPGFRGSGVPGFRGSGVPGFPGFPGFQNPTKKQQSSDPSIGGSLLYCFFEMNDQGC
ncbi:hypothetical protein C171_25766 [Paenibacillus sp. FSL H8-237]|nr:hypothetical protein C171_25766 [Paenibacillus sp. FSL H8-237]